MNIGDSFIINHKEIKKTYKSYIICDKFDAIFEILSFSKSMDSVYFNWNFVDGCKCNTCRSYNNVEATFSDGGNGKTSSIGISYITIVKNLLIEI